MPKRNLSSIILAFFAMTDYLLLQTINISCSKHSRFHIQSKFTLMFRYVRVGGRKLSNYASAYRHEYYQAHMIVCVRSQGQRSHDFAASKTEMIEIENPWLEFAKRVTHSSTSRSAKLSVKRSYKLAVTRRGA